MVKYGSLIGDVYGRLEVIKHLGKNKNGQNLWECICVCGKKVNVHTSYLKTGHTKSCGCFRVDVIKKMTTTHGMSHKLDEYGIWCGMKGRCSDVNNADYYQRGIIVCSRWVDSFENFLSDMGKRPSKKHSIERRHNDGNYEPANCYWGTKKIQAGNRRSNAWHEHEGRRMIIQDWAIELKVDPRNLRWHLQRRTLTETIEFYKNKKTKK